MVGSYKGFFVKVSLEAVNGKGAIICEVVGTDPVVVFQVSTTEEIKSSFQKAVDGYLEEKTKKGEKPLKDYSGRFLLRISPDLHRRVFEVAKREGKSINNWLVGKIKERFIYLGLEVKN
jgi:predicted HicB family RNase H-like nuclease